MSNSCNVGASTCRKWHPKILDYIERYSCGSIGSGKRITIAGMCRDLQVSRPALYTHLPFITETLDRLGRERQRTDGKASLSELQSQLAKATDDLAKSRDAVHALRTDILIIFQTLALRDLPLAALIQAELQKVPRDTSACPCCRQTFHQIADNIVKLHEG